MKKLITTVFAFLLFTQVSFAVTYYSQGSGAPHTLANWNTVRAGGGSTPGNFTTAGDFFVIQNTHVMTTTAVWSVSGSGTTLQIESGGNLVAASTFAVTIGSTATFQIDNGGTYTHSNATAFGTTIMQGTESFGSSSTVIFTDWNSTGPIVSSWGNIVFNAPGAVAGSMQFSNNLTTVNGRLEIIATGSTPREIRLATTGSYTLTIGGDLIISGGIFNPASGASGGTRTINIGGNFNMTAGTFSHTNTTATTLNFTGTNKTWTQSGGTFTNTNLTWGINSGASLTLASNFAIASTRSLVNNGTLDCATFAVTGAGAFTMAATNATLRVGSSLGLAAGTNGNIQVSGTRTYNFNGTGNTFEYNGTGAQVTGAELTGNTLTNLTISNTAGAVTASGNLTVSGNATVSTNATLTLGTLTLTGSGGSAAFAGTGTISLDAIAQVSGFTNSFGGTYYLTGTNPNVPTGTYAGLTVNGGGATMTGDVTVSGTLNLNGTFTVGTNTLTISNPIGVTPTNLVTDQTSALVINGSAANIHIPSSVTQLDDLEMNNSNVVVADGNIRIRSLFTLTNGFLNMGANTLEIGHSTALVGDISRTGGSVRGIIKRWFAASTVSNRIFPLDNGSGAYSAANISFTSAPGTGGSLTASFNNSGPGSLPGGFLATGPEMSNVNLINIAPQWWTITAADGLSGGTYTLDITGDALPNVVDINYIAIIKRIDNGNPWTYTSGNFSVTTGSNSNPVLHYVGGTTFSDFGVGGNVDNPLPVELSSFTSSVSGKNVTLNWSTITETNNSGFDIERKSASATWTKIGNVEGSGTVTAPVNYTFSDRNLNTGNYSYRLKQIDFNGNYKYFDLSNEVIIGTPKNYSLSQNFPNPFNPSTSISYEIPTSNFVSLKIYDMMGKEVANLVSGNQEAGFYTVKFDASKLSSGIYFYKLQANDFTATKKLMLLK